MNVPTPLPTFTASLELPDGVTVLEPPRLAAVERPSDAIAQALAYPIEAPPLDEIARRTLAAHAHARAVVVISDNTRPVPYKGSSGILWPVIERLLDAGFRTDQVTVVVATGTHRQLSRTEIAELLDPRVLASGVAVECHDAFDPAGLVRVGRTAAGLAVSMNRTYVEAHLRILTGLVESHLMAGASGGRKSICPGLVGVDSVRDFHSAQVLADPKACDLVIAGNPCHNLALEIAGMAPADFIVNVTMREDGALMGVFAGDMVLAHERAIEDLKRFAAIPLHGLFDVVVTHAGKVGVNHYQAGKAAAVAAMAVKPGGSIILVADTSDPDPIGSAPYRALMGLLREIGAEAFVRLILSPDWTFVPDQWQAQMWARVFARIPMQNLYYFSPQTPAAEYPRLPGRPPAATFPAEVAHMSKEGQLQAFVAEALRAATAPRPGAARPSVAVLPAGPYAIPTPVSP